MPSYVQPVDPDHPLKDVSHATYQKEKTNPFLSLATSLLPTLASAAFNKLDEKDYSTFLQSQGFNVVPGAKYDENTAKWLVAERQNDKDLANRMSIAQLSKSENDIKNFKVVNDPIPSTERIVDPGSKGGLFGWGALEYPGTLDNLLTVDAVF